MIIASQLRAGMAIRFEGQTYKVLAADYRPGQGQMGGALHARLQNLSTGTTWEHSFRADLKLEEAPLERRSMEFLYRDGGDCYFMDPDNYEQVTIPGSLIGERAKFLEPQMRVPVEFMEERAVSVEVPQYLEVKIADTAPPSHQQQDSNWKPARLENDVDIMVPQFIKNGDLVRLDLSTMKYMDRVKTQSK